MPDIELGRLFHDLAVAWRALSAYPPGHPTAAEALDRAHVSLAAVAAGGLELGVARDGLLRGTERFDGATASKLADLLRRRGAAAVSFSPACTASELETFLRALFADPRRARAAGSLARELEAAGVVGVAVRDLDFSGFRLVEDDGAVRLPEAGGLWERLVKRLIAGGQVSGERWASWVAGGGGAGDLFAALLGLPGASGGSWTPRAGEPPLGESTLGEAALDEAASDFAERSDAEAGAGIGLLWDTVDPPRRARLSAALAAAIGSATGGGEAAAPLLAALPDAPAEAVRTALAAAAATATAAGTADRPAALDTAALERLRRMFATGDLDAAGELDVDEAAEAILELPRGADPVEVPPAALKVAQELAGTPLDRAVAAALIELATRPELDGDALPAVLDLLLARYRELLAIGRFQVCAGLAERLARAAGGSSGEPADHAPQLRGALDRMANAESVAALVGGLRQPAGDSPEAARELLAALGGAAVRHLLIALALEEDRGGRYRLLELLASLGPLVVPDAAALLSDTRWYVVRNMLILLRRVGDPGSLPHIRAATAHPDLRVRLEAIRNLFAFEAAASRELLRAAILDSNPRLAAEAIELAGSHGIGEAVDPLVELLSGWDPFGRRRALRLKAIQALGELADGSALAGLGRFAARLPWPPVAAEERRALYRTLGAYPAEARRGLVERGRRSRDPEVRRLSERLAAQPAARPAPGPADAEGGR